jgi:hypothetical protein
MNLMYAPIEMFYDDEDYYMIITLKVGNKRTRDCFIVSNENVEDLGLMQQELATESFCGGGINSCNYKR